jgi:hypothetical protein
MYIGAATDATASRIVLAAECFVSPRFFDARVIQRYSSAVVLHPKPDTHFADLQHVCEFVRQNMHVSSAECYVSPSLFDARVI